MFNTDKEWVDYYTSLIDELPAPGTKKYAQSLHNVIIKCKDCPRKEDLKFTMIIKYIEHYMILYQNKHNIKFNPNNIYKIRIPNWIKTIC